MVFCAGWTGGLTFGHAVQHHVDEDVRAGPLRAAAVVGEKETVSNAPLGSTLCFSNQRFYSFNMK